jgi:Zn-dependent metalloprotease
MYFGQGYAVDDVTAHELTHGVTQEESGLIYANASGALNESFSDVWGEFVDLGNGQGTDTANVRWLIGEDMPIGSIRNMRTPPAFSDPDRLGSSFFIPPTTTPDDTNDFGGVHTNSGVNNKLCFLLTDGESFNGQVVTGMGINRVAGLYYEAAANLLTSGANFTDLYFALAQAAINLGWSIQERNNLYRACAAVEIASQVSLYVDKGEACFISTGNRVCNSLVGGPFRTVSQGVNNMRPGDFLFIRAGSYNEQVVFSKIGVIRSYDGIVTIGQ